jgi:hypothetical protein
VCVYVCVCMYVYIYTYIYTYTHFISIFPSICPLFIQLAIYQYKHEIYRLTSWRHGQHPWLRRVVLLRRAGGLQDAASRSQPHSTSTPTPNTSSCGCEEEEVAGGGGECGCWCGYWCGFRNSELFPREELFEKQKQSLLLRAWDVAELKHAIALPKANTLSPTALAELNHWEQRYLN